jgi:CO/xanthine dehydrogenase Mo-binding subunit
MAPGAPILHHKGGEAKGNIFVEIHGENGSVEDGFKAADVIHEKTYSTSRVQHVHLETHGCLVWRGDDGRIHVRSTRRRSSPSRAGHIFGLFPGSIRVNRARRGGFGGKLEMIVETFVSSPT